MIKLSASLIIFFFLFSVIKAQIPSLVWAKGFGGSLSDFSSDIALDAYGNVYSTGTFKNQVDFDPNAGTWILNSASPTYEDIYISKLDTNGNLQWAKQIGDTLIERSTSIAVDVSGNIYITGYFKETVDFDPNAGVVNLVSAFGTYDFFICKLDSSGSLLWAKSVGSSFDDISNSITLDESGNVYTTGFFEGTVDFDPGIGVHNLISGVFADAFILKLDAQGNFIWVKDIGGTAIENGRKIKFDGRGNIYTMGSFQNTSDFDPDSLGTYYLTSAGVNDIYISKLDSGGNFIWARQLGGTSYDLGNGMTVDAIGNVYITGTFQDTADFNPDIGIYNLVSYGASQDIFICKLDSSGSFNWAISMGGAHSDQGNSIEVDLSGSIFVTGLFYDSIDFNSGSGINILSALSSDIFILKLDGAGNYQWAFNMGQNSSDNGSAILADNLGNIYTMGDYQLTTDFDPNAGIVNLTSHGYTDIFIQKLTEPTTNINFNSAFSSLNVFPIPTTGILNLNLPKNQKIIKLEVINAYGQVVAGYEKFNEIDGTLFLKNQASGIYFLSVQTDSGNYSTKIVIFR